MQNPDPAHDMPTAYTLKDGEYFYYTNQDKSDLAYYGAGTKIKISNKTPTIYKSKNDSSISATEIATYGLSAAIPWRSYSLSDESYIKLTEYQYRNLVAGDKLETLGVSGGGGTPTTIEAAITSA